MNQESKRPNGAKNYIEYVHGKIDQAKAAKEQKGRSAAEEILELRRIRTEFIRGFEDFRLGRKFNPVIYKGVFVPGQTDLLKSRLVLVDNPPIHASYLDVSLMFEDSIREYLSEERMIKANVSYPSFDREAREFLEKAIGEDPKGKLRAENSFLRLKPQLGMRSGVMTTVYYSSQTQESTALVWQCIRGEKPAPYNHELSMRADMRSFGGRRFS